MQRQRDLLELAREPLLARAHPRDELLRRLGIELEAELARVPDAPFRQLPRLGGRVLARLAAGLLDRLGQRLWRLPASNEDNDRVWRQVLHGLLQRAELVRLPGADVVHEQVARGGVEAQHRE